MERGGDGGLGRQAGTRSRAVARHRQADGPWTGPNATPPPSALSPSLTAEAVAMQIQALHRRRLPARRQRPAEPVVAEQQQLQGGLRRQACRQQAKRGGTHTSPRHASGLPPAPFSLPTHAAPPAGGQSCLNQTRRCPTTSPRTPGQGPAAFAPCPESPSQQPPQPIPAGQLRTGCCAPTILLSACQPTPHASISGCTPPPPPAVMPCRPAAADPPPGRLPLSWLLRSLTTSSSTPPHCSGMVPLQRGGVWAEAGRQLGAGVPFSGLLLVWHLASAWRLGLAPRMHSKECRQGAALRYDAQDY